MSTAKKHITATGDRMNDGAIQLSFTLSVPLQTAQAAAIEFCRKMNLLEIEIVSLQPISADMTYIQAFAKTTFTITIPENTISKKRVALSREEILQLTRGWDKKLTVVGACTGTDAHTTGLDAILNKKGYKGDKGLESYPFLNIINLGSQVKNSELVTELKKNKADVLLISQVITHQNVHLHNLTELIDMLEAVNLRSKIHCLIGGPRITDQLALELGFDAGFGLGTLPVDVASYIYIQLSTKT